MYVIRQGPGPAPLQYLPIEGCAHVTLPDVTLVRAPMATFLTLLRSTKGHPTCFCSPYSSGGIRSPRPKFARVTEVFSTPTAHLPRWNMYYAARWLSLNLEG